MNYFFILDVLSVEMKINLGFVFCSGGTNINTRKMNRILLLVDSEAF
jgi:hypothetical protein